MEKDLIITLENEIAFEDLLGQHMIIQNGYSRNTIFYSILKSEWETIKKQYFTNFTVIL
jgi:N-acetyltransferase